MNIYTKSCLKAIKELQALDRNEYQTWAQEELDRTLKIARSPSGPSYAKRVIEMNIIDRPFFGWSFV